MAPQTKKKSSEARIPASIFHRCMNEGDRKQEKAVKPDRKWIKPELSGREKMPKQHQHRCEQPENRKNRGPPISRKEASPEKYCFGEVFRNK